MRTALQTARWFGTSVEDVAFGHVLRRVRKAAGFTQAKLAELLPMEKSRLVRFETGRQHVRVADMLAIEAGQAIIDIGYKGSGTINIDEFNNPDGTVGVAVGDIVEVLLEHLERRALPEPYVQDPGGMTAPTELGRELVEPAHRGHR